MDERKKNGAVIFRRQVKTCVYKGRCVSSGQCDAVGYVRW